MKKTLSLLAILLLTIYSASAEMVQAFEMQTNKASGSTITLGFVAGGTQTVGVDWGDGTIVTYTGISNSINTPTNKSDVTAVDQAIIKVYVDGSSITNLVCSGNGLTSLDLSKTNSLTRLTVSNNNLPTLDVSNQINLQQLVSIGGNNTCFKGIYLSKNTVLNTLTIRNGGLEFAKELDLSNNPNMSVLSIQNDGQVNANNLNACALDSIYRMLPDRVGKSIGTIFVGRSDYIKTPNNDYQGSNKTLVDGKNWIVKTTTNNATLTGDGGGCILPPVASPISEVSTSSFTANWQTVDGIDSYKLSVYTKDEEGAVTQILNSPFSVESSVTSKNITGLSNTNLYYYSVIAVKGDIESGVSNEIGPVSLLTTALTNIDIDTKPWVANGKIMFYALSREIIEIYNVAGQKLHSFPASDGVNRVAVTENGVLIIKVSNRISKVIF